MSNPIIERRIAAFDKQFGKRGPEGDSDSIGRRAGCDDCSQSIAIREEHRDFFRQSLTIALAEQRRELGEEIGKRKRQTELSGEIYDPMKADPACVSGFNLGLSTAIEIIEQQDEKED